MSNINPIVTGSVVDINPDTIALTGDSSTLIKYYSSAHATMSATAQGGAAIDTDLYVIRNGSRVGYGTSYIFDGVESNEFSFSAADSRGNVGTTSIIAPMVNYVKLTCNMTNQKPDASGNMDVQCTGSYFNGSFGAVANTLEVKCRYKTQGGSYSNWITMTVTKTGNYYGAYASFTIPNFDYHATYVFECLATDKLTTITATPYSAKSTPAFHWGENDFVFEVPVTFNAGMTAESYGDNTIDGDLTVTGNLRLKGSGNYGNILRFGDGDYCMISEDSDDELTIRARAINLVSDEVVVNNNSLPLILCGTWQPSLVTSWSLSYSKRYGWYSMVGQTVTVGFHIKATCNSGAVGDLVRIDGLPFTPMYPASGGGICSGAYVGGGFTFQGFVAETDGTITTRVQACNNLSDTNLSTTASGCYYPNGGGEITLSGTITYLYG